MLDSILTSLHKYLISRETVVMLGLYAYSAILQSCSIKNDDVYMPDFISHYEIISDNYKSDINDLIALLKTEYKTYSSKFRISEHYPFLDLYGHNTKIYYDDTLIFWGFSSNNKCVPYHKLKTVVIKNNNFLQTSDFIKIGSFSQLIMMNLTISMHYKLVKSKEMLNYHQKLTQELFLLRSHYFKINNSTIMSKTPFNEIVLQCMGTHVNPQKEYYKKINMKMKDKTGPYIFKYDPSDPSNPKNDIINFKFANSSSNPINDESDLQLTN